MIFATSGRGSHCGHLRHLVQRVSLWASPPPHAEDLTVGWRLSGSGRCAQLLGCTGDLGSCTLCIATAKPLQSCPTPCDPMDRSLQGSSVHGILRARTLEWVPWPPPGDLPDPGTEPASLTSPALIGRFFTISAAWEIPKDSLVAQLVKNLPINGKVPIYSFLPM